MTRALKTVTAYAALIVPTILAGTQFVEAVQSAGSTHELQVTGHAGVPTDASAVVLNITSAQASGTGYITAYPCGQARPNASNLNYGVGPPVANSAIVMIGTGGKVCLFTADNDTELIVDINGWFPKDSDFTTSSPTRILDTRPGLGTADGESAGEGPRPAGSTYDLQVRGRAGVPAQASAVVLNITSAEASGTGYITAYPCGSPRPNASNLNYGVGPPVANTAIVKIGTGGKVCLFTADNDTELIADVNGWFATTTPSDYTSASPARLLDTRRALATVDGLAAGDGVRRAGEVSELQVTGRAGVPTAASAVVLNITSAQASGTGYITAYPCGSPRPNASNLNYGVGPPVANTAIVKIGTGGKVCLFTADNDTELIADVNGWFSAGSDYEAISPQRVLDTRDAPTSGAAFVETFTGNTGLQRFRTGVLHRDGDIHGFGLGAPGENTWPADHDHNCGPPETKRILDKTDRAGSFFNCRDHMMTSMGHVDGYSVVWFSPNQTFSSISRVCWDVNVSSNLLGHRQWWEVGILPVGQPDVFAIDWLAGTANLPNYGEVNAVVLGFGPDSPPYPKLSVGNDVVGGGSINDADRNDIAKRVPHCLRDNGNGTITYSNDTPSGGFTAPGSFPAGQLKVVFKDHSYTPDKDCGHLAGGVCASYTWHWDNIIVE